MDDYISREAAMPDSFCVGVSCQECPFRDDPIKGGCKVAQFINSIPSANVTEVKHGRWVDKWMCSNMTGYEYACRCSECNKPTYRINTLEPMPPYCPNCGTKMDGSDKNA